MTEPLLDAQFILPLVGIFYTLLMLAGVICLTVLGLQLARGGRREGRAESSPVATVAIYWPEARRLLGILLLLFVLTNAGFALYGKWFGQYPSTEMSIVLQSLSFHWVIILFLLARKGQTGLSLKRAFGFSTHTLGRDVRAGFFYYLAAMPVVFFYALLSSLLLRFFDITPEPQESIVIMTETSGLGLQVYFFFITALLAPISEELLFRGYLLPLLGRKIGWGWAVALLSLFFAMIHMHLTAIIPLAVIAAAFALAYLKTGSLVTPIVMHGLFNGINITMFYLLVKSGVDIDGTFMKMGLQFLPGVTP